MKNTSLFLLLLVASEGYAQDCWPADWQHPQVLRGCDQIYKREDSTVNINGVSKLVIQDGWGECAVKAACNPWEFELNRLIGNKEQCWPQFYSPEKGPGYWSRRRTNGKVSFGYAGTCRDSNDDSLSYPMLGPKCVTGDEDRQEVRVSCQIVVTYPPPIDVEPYWPPWGQDPCWSFFLQGQPCPYNW